MTTSNIKSNSAEENKNVVILIDKYTTVELSEISEMCNANDLNISCIIYNYMLHDVKPYKEIIKYIVSQDKPPVVIIDSNTCLFPQCIMSSTLLGTLEAMKQVEIHTYNKELKKNKLTLATKSTFDLLTEATWQLRSIEEVYEERNNKIKQKGESK